MTRRPRAPMALRALSRLHGRLGGHPRGRRLLRALGVRRFSRAWLRRVLDRAAEGPDDVTVLVGVRNRADHRIVNALRSLEAQTLPSGAVRTLVVDYGSRPAAARFTEEACRRHGAEYLRVEDVDVWSRSRCLNVGIRRVDTTFLMASDADVVLSAGYLADAVRALRREPFSVICSAMLDLPESSDPAAKRAARVRRPLPLRAWKREATPRLEWELHPSIAVAHTACFRLVRGYDEFYEVWGEEDEDLMRRFGRLGLEPRPVGTDSFYLHQWHPKFEGVPGGEDAEPVRRNREHARRAHSILRNGPGWGRPDGRVRAGGEAGRGGPSALEGAPADASPAGG